MSTFCFLKVFVLSLIINLFILSLFMKSCLSKKSKKSFLLPQPPCQKPPVCASVPSASCLRPYTKCLLFTPLFLEAPLPPVMGCCSFARRTENRWTNQIILLWPGALFSPSPLRLETSTPECFLYLR
jgi:hypothetical protein